MPASDPEHVADAAIRIARLNILSMRVVTAGGRVLTVVGRGVDFAEAISLAYTGVRHIRFDGMHYRRDIGKKALTRGSAL